jgi:hypothetical protein
MYLTSQFDRHLLSCYQAPGIVVDNENTNRIKSQTALLMSQNPLYKGLVQGQPPHLLI